MDWETLYCPNRDCRYYGVPFAQSRIVRNGAYKGQKQGLYQACHRSISLRYGTAYFGLESDPALFETAVRALAEGNSIRATGRIVQVDKDTVGDWLNRAAKQCRLVMLYLWRNLHITECQLDELWSFVHTKEQNLAAAKIYCETYGDAWVWVAFAPVWRMVLAFVIGKRSQESANLLLDRVAYVTDDHIPFFTSDQLSHYKNALLHTYGVWHQPQRQGKRGPHPKPRLIAPSNLLYAQVVKKREKGRVVEVATKIIFGHEQAVADKLDGSLVSQTINTIFVERDNLTQRLSNRRLTRRTNGFSKEMGWFEKQLWLSLAYYHLILPHYSLRQPLLEPQITRGTGTLRKWKPITPAMAACMTDHVWTTSELLSYRVPFHFLDTLSEIEHLFPSLEPNYQGK